MVQRKDGPEIQEGGRMAKFVKKPIPIEAVQQDKTFSVDTLEGVMSGRPGDYLVTGVKGEQYPVEREVFESTYVEYRSPPLQGSLEEHMENAEELLEVFFLLVGDLESSWVRRGGGLDDFLDFKQRGKLRLKDF